MHSINLHLADKGFKPAHARQYTIPRAAEQHMEQK
jgi:hypothetical protein